MLIDYDILKHFGTDKARIRKVFTAVEGTPEYDIRKKWEDKIKSRVQNGTEWCLKNYQFYAAADLAMDTNVISKEMIPLSLYAQGKITLQSAETKLKNISAESLAKFAKYDAKSNVVEIDVPAFHKVVVALARSFVTIRTSSLSSRYVKNTPFLKYEPLAKGYVAQLLGDVLTQRIEMISNAYGYRHDLTQRIMSMLTYGYSVEFAECAWEQEKTLRKAKGAEMMEDGTLKIESVIAREGIPFKGVHPTRMFYDMAYPLASINTDTGCSYLGHWDLVPYRKVRDNPTYFNRENIKYDRSFSAKIVGSGDYFELYSATAPVNFPNPDQAIAQAVYNDRDVNANVYSSDESVADSSILFTEYFEKIIPSQCGLGEYPQPVWVRLVVAADNTVVFGEFMPYAPAVYYGYNIRDSKVLNMSFVHDAMAFQDQCSNILTSMLLAQKSALVKIISLDISQINDSHHIETIRKIISTEALFTTPLLIEHRGDQSAQLGQDKKKIIEISEATKSAELSSHVSVLLQLYGLAERLLGMSANEQGRSEPREVSATESSIISNTTNSSLAFMGQGIDEGLAAKKRILYEGLMARGEANIRVPVAESYTDATVQAAGFEVDSKGSATAPDGVARRVTIKGKKSALEYDFNFANRDGGERPNNAKAAEVMTLLFQQLAQVPGLLNSWGVEQMYEFLNTIVRMAGVPAEVNFRIPDGAPTTSVGVAPEQAQQPQAILQDGTPPTIPAAAAQVSSDKTGGFLN